MQKTWRRVTKRAKPRETEIQADILEALRALGHFAWRQNNIPVPIIVGKERVFKGFRKSLTPGIPDVMAVRKGDGRFIAVEVKRPGKRPSEDQMIFLDQVRRKGGIAIVATSIDDVLNHPDLL